LEEEPDMEHACACNTRQVIGAWQVFPIYPKFAALFLKGIPLVKGFKLGDDLSKTFPAEYADNSSCSSISSVWGWQNAKTKIKPWWQGWTGNVRTNSRTMLS
jgi:hypothetical protein